MGETVIYCTPIAGTHAFSAVDMVKAIGLMANSGIKMYLSASPEEKFDNLMISRISSACSAFTGSFLRCLTYVG